MKEILKYLRNLNSYTQDEVAKKIGLSRQSYNKYENGSVVPSDACIKKLADLYKVSENFIRENKIPIPQYYIPKDLGPLIINEPEVHYGSSKGTKTAVLEKPAEQEPGKPKSKTYEAWFDGTGVRVENPDFEFYKGMKFKIVVDDEEEIEYQRRHKAWLDLQKIINENPIKMEFDDDDPYYKKAIARAKDEYFKEKYGIGD